MDPDLIPMICQEIRRAIGPGTHNFLDVIYRAGIVGVGTINTNPYKRKAFESKIRARSKRLNRNQDWKSQPQIGKDKKMNALCHLREMRQGVPARGHYLPTLPANSRSSLPTPGALTCQPTGRQEYIIITT